MVIGDDIYIPTPVEKVITYLVIVTLEISYEDDDLAIVMKPKGVKTHPNDLKR